jgi:hypothetical protein
MCILSTQNKNVLIGSEQRRSIQIVSPGSQQLILLEVHQFSQEEYRVHTDISSYKASVTTCAGIGICHNQHIRGFYEKALISDIQKPASIRSTNAQRPDYDSNCCLRHWDSLILEQTI